MADMLVALFGERRALSTPFRFTAKGAIIGLVIGYFATRFGGDGGETLAGSD